MPKVTQDSQHTPSVDDLRTQIQSCMMQRQNLEAIFNSVTDGIIAAPSFAISRPPYHER